MGVSASKTLSVASPTDLADITFRIVDQTRYPEVLELLYANFHPDEPMSKALKIYDGKNRIPSVDEYTLNALRENLSIMAIDSFTNKLLGVAINARGQRKYHTAPLDVSHIKNDKFQIILTVLHEVNQLAPDLYDKLKTDETFEIRMVTTDKVNRRGGLGTDLLKRSVQLAKTMGFKACKTEATGVYSRKAFERLGFSVTAELYYSNFQDENGVFIFKDSNLENHKCVTLLTMKLQVSQSSIDEGEEKD